MKISSERVLTTHTGSLPRPASLTDRHDGQAVQAAVRDTVQRQLAAGVDVINDGEASKPSYSTYVTERLSGFGGEPVAVRRWGMRSSPSTPASSGARRPARSAASRPATPAATAPSPTRTC